MMDKKLHGIELGFDRHGAEEEIDALQLVSVG